MSYTPPSATAVNFAFTGASYTAPSAGSTNFIPLTDINRLRCSGGIEFGGAFTMAMGVSSLYSGAVSLRGSGDLYHLFPMEVLCTGAARLGGHATIARGTVFAGPQNAVVCTGSTSVIHIPPLSASGGIALCGGSHLGSGGALVARGPMKLSGGVSFATGRRLYVTGKLPALLGTVTIRHGNSLTGNGSVDIRGRSGLHYMGEHTVALSGGVQMTGAVRFYSPRRAPMPSISVIATPQRLEVFCRGN